MKTRAVPGFLILAGLLMMGISIFAHSLGLDSHPGWGRGRSILLAAGVLTVAAGFFLQRYGARAKPVHDKVSAAIRNSSLFARAAENRFVKFLFVSHNGIGILTAGFLVVFVAAFYTWLASAGHWAPFPPTTDYYDQLATSFTHGRLSLEMTPDPALLALPNPYDPLERRSVDFPGDVSLYQGKFYLYFGPVPALILASLKPVFSGSIGDQYLVFAFIAGIFVFQLLLMLGIWKRFYATLPKWTLLPGIMILGLEHPLALLLDVGDFHAAAIAGGQFFFIGGLYFLYVALNGESFSRLRLTLAGIFFAAAAGSRATLLLPVGFLSLMAAFEIIRQARLKAGLAGSAVPALALGAPIAAGLAGLGWYNWARFGSMFDFGFLYQLTWNNIREFSGILFSPVYILQNLYNYFLRPFRFSHLFPFVMGAYGAKTSLLPNLPIPSIYYVGLGGGLILTTPFLLLAIFPIVDSARALLQRENRREKPPFLYWLRVCLAGSVLAAFAPLLLFFWNDMRYLADLIPAFTLLSLIGFWQGISWMRQQPAGWKPYLYLSTGAAALSAVINLLLSISEGLDRFRLFNPDLIHWLRNVLVIYR